MTNTSINSLIFQSLFFPSETVPRPAILQLRYVPQQEVSLSSEAHLVGMIGTFSSGWDYQSPYNNFATVNSRAMEHHSTAHVLLMSSCQKKGFGALKDVNLRTSASTDRFGRLRATELRIIMTARRGNQRTHPREKLEDSDATSHHLRGPVHLMVDIRTPLEGVDIRTPLEHHRAQSSNESPDL
ncbi:hypothetical protein BC826DRAFT_969961 [Russula brevipes]|nr:hypothetical protein BC826DRAFT_969961 [Russula brevipes]